MRTIDLRHLGRERVIAAYLVDGVVIDPGPSSCLPALLDALLAKADRSMYEDKRRKKSGPAEALVQSHE